MSSTDVIQESCFHAWYNTDMSTVSNTEILDRLLEPVTNCFSREIALRLVNLRADAEIQARIDKLAELANEGELSEEERAEYAAYVDAINFIGVLQAKARRVLAAQSDSRTRSSS